MVQLFIITNIDFNYNVTIVPIEAPRAEQKIYKDMFASIIRRKNANRPQFKALSGDYIVYDDLGYHINYGRGVQKYHNILLYGEEYRFFNIKIEQNIIDGKPVKFFQMNVCKHLSNGQISKKDYIIVRDLKPIKKSADGYYTTYEIIDLLGEFIRG